MSHVSFQTPTIVDVDVSIVDFDLITANEHLHTSEVCASWESYMHRIMIHIHEI